jgi:feruloyl esterase
VTHAALAACHGERGYIADPDACKFDPSTLLCKADQKEGCLTSPELAALRKIYSGAHDAAGRPISPGFVPGGEAGPTSWPLWITGSGPQRTAVTLGHGFAHGYFADMVFDNPEWTFRGQNLADALAAADAKTGPIVNSADPDLGPFFAAGGKLLQYHGWNDAAIPPQYSIDYYKSVADKTGGVEKLQASYRLFMAPGMEHCGGGPGPNAVGGVYGAPSPNRDPEHDVVAALAHWVEDGAAPARIIASLHHDGDPAKDVVAQRPWCPYPASARYSGQGIPTDAASYACAAP